MTEAEAIETVRRFAANGVAERQRLIAAAEVCAQAFLSRGSGS